jgi:hypothetical protein
MKTSETYEKVIIGIDPGVTTGLAFVDGSTGNLFRVESHSILAAMQEIRNFRLTNNNTIIQIFIENPSKRKWFGNTGREVLQGAGSIKRDYSIWLEFFKMYVFQFQEVDPKNNRTKVRASSFNSITKWRGKTNEHSRDAAMMIFGKRINGNRLLLGILQDDGSELILDCETASSIEIDLESITPVTKRKKQPQEMKLLKGHWEEVKNQNPPSTWKKNK